jgi:hypothetical protein
MVVKQVKTWLVQRANASRWRGLQEWAESRRADFQLHPEGIGFFIDQPSAKPGPLRVEWGPSQRDYIEGNELRMRCEMGLSPELQMMVVCRKLMDKLEATVFEAYTDTLQTRLDTETPEEMRWLVMFPKFAPPEGRELRERLGFIGVHKDLLASWVEAEFGEVLPRVLKEAVPEGVPFLLMCLRGNLYLRVSMPEPDLERVQALVRLLEVAAREAYRIQGRIGEAVNWPTTMASTFQSTRPN